MVEPTDLFEKYARQNWIISPGIGVKIKNISVATTQEMKHGDNNHQFFGKIMASFQGGYHEILIISLICNTHSNTVDGNQKSGSPVEVGSLSHY